MRVKDLIEKLERLDLEGEIRFRGLIEIGRSVSFTEVDGCDIKEEGDGDKVVVLEVSGIESGRSLTYIEVDGCDIKEEGDGDGW